MVVPDVVTGFSMKEPPMFNSINEYLIHLYERSKHYQMTKNVQFDITLEQYLVMWSKKKSAMNRITKQYEVSLRTGNPFRPKTNLVLSWKKDMCRKGLPMNTTTAGLYTFENSKLNCKLRKGEKKTPEAKAKISRGCKGKPKSTTVNMKKPKSAEHKAAMAEAARLRWAKKRGEVI